MKTRLYLCIAAPIALVASACSGSSKAVTTTTKPSTSTTLATTTSSTTTTTSVTTTTVKPDGPVWPLTGVPVTFVEMNITGRPAVVAKISNDSCARPQVGLSQADVITEEIAEGDITRFFAAFHSKDPGAIGPIRSGRGTDAQYLEMFNRPVLAWSGGNPSVHEIIRNTNVQDRSAESSFGGMYYRSGSRCNSNTEFVKVSDEWASAEKDSKAPHAIFDFVKQGVTAPEGSGALPVPDVQVTVGENTLTYKFDRSINKYKRYKSNGSVHEDEAGNPIAPTNVVVAFTTYTPAVYYPVSPEAHGVGSGEVWVLSGGSVIHGSWTRASVSDTWHLTDPKGGVIKLLPGQTIVELAKGNSVQLLGS